jgi:hypothetical protein
MRKRFLGHSFSVARIRADGSPRVGWRIEKDEAVNSTDSQFYGINNDIQFLGENPRENFEGESK